MIERIMRGSAVTIPDRTAKPDTPVTSRDSSRAAQWVRSVPEGFLELFDGHALPWLPSLPAKPSRTRDVLSVTRLIAKCLATSALVMFELLSIAAALRTSALDILGLRPTLAPTCPRCDQPGHRAFADQNLAVELDLYSRKVVSWSKSERMTVALVCDALRMVLFRRHRPHGCAKFIGPIRQVMVRGLVKVYQVLVLAMTGYNLVRIRTLARLAAAGQLRA
jgi:hypothetical protein